MKKLVLFLLPLFMSSCAGLKVQHDAPPATKPKSGLTLGSGAVGSFQVQKGYWCDVRATLLTFGASGPTEAKATEIAKANCHSHYPDSACELVACKPN